MGAWGTSVDANDPFQDIYSAFFELYNEGVDPVSVSEKILKDFNPYEADIDEKNNLLFGLAFAQWETKCLDNDLFLKVKRIIESEEDIKLWEGLPEKEIEKRRKVLSQFLEKISIERPKPKRRQKPKFEFETKELINITAPDNRKRFYINEEFVNGKYIHTGSCMDYFGSGSGIAYFEGENKKISARWIDNNTLEIYYEKGIQFVKQELFDRHFTDIIRIIYKEIYENNSAQNLSLLIDQAISKFERIPVEGWSYKPNPSKWSKKEILGHLIDSAQNNLRRFIVTQYQQNDNIVYMQDDWVLLQDYQYAPIHEIIGLWKLLNQQICRVIDKIPQEKLRYTCNTGKGNEELHTLEFLIEDYIVHMQHHLKAILS